MTNVISKILFAQYTAFEAQLSNALDMGDEKLVTQSLAQLNQFAAANGIDLALAVTQVGETPPTTNDPGFIKPGGWGSKSIDSSGWKVVKMRDTPQLYKVVDEIGINIATNFKTAAGAGAFIDAHPKGGGTPTPPAPSPSPPAPSPSGGGLDALGQKMMHPSKPGGQVITTSGVRYFTRNYSSGKPSEPTVEMDITGINFANQECTAIVTMTGMSHPDTLDWKMRGGSHSSSDPKAGTCYDIEVMTDGSPSKTLEVESPHPDNHPAHQKALFSPGDLANKRFGWKGVTLTTADGKGVLIESYINLTPDDQNGWKKYISVVDTGQLYKGTSPILKPYGTIAKIRIDGIKGKPTFDKISCREITN